MGVKMYVPSVRVTVVSVNDCPSWVMVTVAPGSTPPEASFTVPRIVPVSTWAPAGAAASSTIARTTVDTRLLRSHA